MIESPADSPSAEYRRGPSDRACHVVCAGFGESDKVTALCGSLPPEVLRAFAEAGVPFRERAI